MKKLTPKEEEILACFWQKGHMFIKELLDIQEEPKPHYNTLSTIVRALEDKGYIGYKAYGNTYRYYAVVSEEEYKKNTLRDVVDKYFGNSYARVVSSFIEEEKLSIDELQDLIRWIKTKQAK
jgi:predicted transcriptional regulator